MTKPDVPRLHSTVLVEDLHVLEGVRARCVTGYYQILSEQRYERLHESSESSYIAFSCGSPGSGEPPEGRR